MFQDFLVDAGALLSGVVEPGKDASIDPQTGNIVVPDAELLFGGKYQQAGRDLLTLGDDGDKFVIPDYFAAKKRPNLQAPDGAVLPADIVDILAGANLAQYAQTELESGRAPIGRVELVTGMATATRNGAQIILQIGDRVFIDVQVNRRAFITLLNIAADGKVTVLYPNASNPSIEAQPGSPLRFPPSGRIKVDPPAGKEMVLAIATTQPLDVTQFDATTLPGSLGARGLTSRGVQSAARRMRTLVLEAAPDSTPNGSTNPAEDSGWGSIFFVFPVS